MDMKKWEDNMSYGIAYKNIDGMDFHGAPWITGGFPTIEEAKMAKNDFISCGFKNVITFMFDKPEDEIELVTWDYVNKHKID